GVAAEVAADVAPDLAAEVPAEVPPKARAEVVAELDRPAGPRFDLDGDLLARAVASDVQLQSIPGPHPARRPGEVPRRLDPVAAGPRDDVSDPDPRFFGRAAGHDLRNEPPRVFRSAEVGPQLRCHLEEADADVAARPAGHPHHDSVIAVGGVDVVVVDDDLRLG